MGSITRYLANVLRAIADALDPPVPPSSLLDDDGGPA
jgi:hypothetical protein